MRNVIASFFSVLMVYGVASVALADESSVSHTYTWSNSYLRQFEANSIRRNAEARASAQVSQGNNGAGYQQGGAYMNNTSAPFVMVYGGGNVATGYYFPYSYQRF